MEDYILKNYTDKKDDNEYQELLFTAFKNLYNKCRYNPSILYREYSNEHCMHYYGKHIMKNILEKQNNNNYCVLEYPLYRDSLIINIVKKLGFNPTNNDVSTLLGKNLIGRCDVVLFNSDDIPIEYYEIYNTSHCSKKKLDGMKLLNMKNVYEIDAGYLMKTKPDTIPKDISFNLTKLF